MEASAAVVVASAVAAAFACVSPAAAALAADPVVDLGRADLTQHSQGERGQHHDRVAVAWGEAGQNLPKGRLQCELCCPQILSEAGVAV